MNEQEIVNHLVSFITEREQKLQANKLAGDPQAKNDIVKAILDELEREMAHEDQ